MKPTLERRRTIRLRRSALIRKGIEDIEKPSIKLAENDGEFRQAFSILYAAYHGLGYIPPNARQLYCSAHHLLPQTRVLVFKAYLEVICTLTRFEDDPVFGLPMDCLYRDELDELRKAGRNLVEVGAFATPAAMKWQNAMFFLQRSVILMSVLQEFSDICIMVNPKHVDYYKSILLFEQFGPEKTYGSFQAPAVPLRLNLDSFQDRLYTVYKDEDFDTNLYDFFYKRELELQLVQSGRMYDVDISFTPPPQLAHELLESGMGLADSLDDARMQRLCDLYPDLTGSLRKA